MSSAQPINADTIQSLWGIPAKAKGAGKLGVSAALWSGRPYLKAYEIWRPACNLTHVVSIWIKGEATSELFLDGRQRFAAVRKRGSFQLARAGESVRALLSKRSGECLDLYVPTSFLQDCLEAEFDKFKPSIELLPLALQDDPAIASIGDSIAAELKCPDSASRLAIDSASLLLAVTLIRKYSNVAESDSSPTGLAEWQKQRAIARLQDMIGLNISLPELASEVRLSPFHFARAFKSSVGMPPHQYLIHLRMERARALLQSEALTISEIAQRVGYRDVGYFARMFRRRFGIAPNAFRRQKMF